MHKPGLITREASTVLGQLFIDGPIWDGNLISKDGRDELVTRGLVGQLQGFNFLTPEGVRFAIVCPVSGDADLVARWSKKQARQ